MIIESHHTQNICSFHFHIMSHNYAEACLHAPYALVQLSDVENV